jgi:integrase
MTRLSNKEYRNREYLTHDEVKQLIDAAYCRGRNGQRDAFLILMMFRHGLRAVEAANLKWSDVYFDRDEIWIERAKGSLSKMHLLQQDEVLELKQMFERRKSEYIFESERSNKLTPDAIHRIVQSAGKTAGIDNCHPHQLRHACGYYLAQQGIDIRTIQEYLGHKNIQCTVIYTAIDTRKFKEIKWG